MLKYVILSLFLACISMYFCEEFVVWSVMGLCVRWLSTIGLKSSLLRALSGSAQSSSSRDQYLVGIKAYFKLCLLDDLENLIRIKAYYESHSPDVLHFELSGIDRCIVIYIQGRSAGNVFIVYFVCRHSMKGFLELMTGSILSDSPLRKEFKDKESIHFCIMDVIHIMAKWFSTNSHQQLCIMVRCDLNLIAWVSFYGAQEAQELCYSNCLRLLELDLRKVIARYLDLQPLEERLLAACFASEYRVWRVLEVNTIAGTLTSSMIVSYTLDDNRFPLRSISLRLRSHWSFSQRLSLCSLSTLSRVILEGDRYLLRKKWQRFQKSDEIGLNDLSLRKSVYWLRLSQSIIPEGYIMILYDLKID